MGKDNLRALKGVYSLCASRLSRNQTGAPIPVGPIKQSNFTKSRQQALTDLKSLILLCSDG